MIGCRCPPCGGAPSGPGVPGAPSHNTEPVNPSCINWPSGAASASKKLERLIHARLAAGLGGTAPSWRCGRAFVPVPCCSAAAERYAHDPCGAAPAGPALAVSAPPFPLCLSDPRAPSLRLRARRQPPRKRQRAFPGSALTRQAPPARVLAPHLGLSLRRVGECIIRDHSG